MKTVDGCGGQISVNEREGEQSMVQFSVKMRERKPSINEIRVF
jgi:hypothetical protein